MPADVRRGDIVTLKAVVIDAAPYDNGEQQVMVELLPRRGKTLGWLLQKEIGFEPFLRRLQVGDIVRLHDDDNDFVVMALFESGQAAVRLVDETEVELFPITSLVRQ